MIQKPLLECSFLIPIRGDPDLSDGKAHPRKAWRWLDMELFQFGGGTRGKEPMEGWYLDADSGQPVRDVSKKFFVAMPRRHLDRLRAVLREACGCVFPEVHLFERRRPC